MLLGYNLIIMDVKAPAIQMAIDQKQRKLIFIIGGLVLLGLILTVATFIFGRSPVGEPLNQLSATQKEVLRVNELAKSLSPDLALGKIQANVGAITSNDIAILEPERARANSGDRLPKEVLDAKVNPDAESLLQSATQRNNLATSYKELISELLNDEVELIAEIRKGTSRQAILDRLKIIEDHITSLQEQIDTL